MLNLANLLTIFRIIVSPVALLLIFYPQNIYISVSVLVIFIAAALSDYFDGKIARKYNLVTNVGKLLDPIADKLMVLFCLGVFVYLNALSLSVLIFIALREIGVTVHRFILVNKNHKVISASWFGKIKTGFQITLIISVMLEIGFRHTLFNSIPYFNEFRFYFSYFTLLVTFIALMLTIASGIDYLIRNVRFIYSSKIFKSFSKIFSNVFYLGHIKKAPGTFGSLAGVVLFYVIHVFCLKYDVSIVNVLNYLIPSLFFLGVITSTVLEKITGKKDDQRIVIDETAGQLAVFYLIPFTESNLLIGLFAGFLLFRIFDITKILFINRTQEYPMGWGVMTDDLIAAFYANILLHSAVRYVL